MNAACTFPSYTSRQSPPARVSLFPLVAVVILIGIVAAATAGAVAQGSLSHAVLKHGNDALLARQCDNGDHHVFRFHNPTTDRFASVCFIDGVWAIRVTDNRGNEITAFVKNRMRDFVDVIRYLANAGYAPVQ